MSIGNALANGEGWRVVDIICTAGPEDRPFEERHGVASVSLVLAGSFVYRSDRGSSLMGAGSLLLGDPGRVYECTHHHGEGDHCLSFQFEPELFERLTGEAGVSPTAELTNHLPPIPAFAPIVARAALALMRNDSWEEIAFELAGAALAQAAQAANGSRHRRFDEYARVSRVLRRMEASIDAPNALTELAEEAGISRYHFLRSFKAAAGVTPHQWLLRARMRDAARRLATTSDPVTEIALDVGFQDLSNFIRSFRDEFGMSPRRYRASP